MSHSPSPDTGTATECSRRNARIYSRRTQCTYEDIREAVGKATTRFNSAGLRSGCLVVLEVDDSIEAIVCLLALAALDARIVLEHPGRLGMFPELGEETFMHLVPKATKKSTDRQSYRQFVDMEPGSSIPADQNIQHPTPSPLALVSNSWLQRTDGLMLISSGSTGAPKIVPRAPGDFIDNLRQSQKILNYLPDDVILPMAPMSHQYGLSVLFHSLLVGSDLVLGSPWRISESVRLGRRYNATLVEAVPDVYLQIADLLLDGRLERNPLPECRQTGVGGSPIDSKSKEYIKSILGWSLCDGYGSSELGNIALARPDKPEMGMEPLENFRLQILDHEGTPTKEGTPGSLRVINASNGSVWNSGDLAVLTTGLLRVIGRANAVHRRGLIVYPSALEDRMREKGIKAAVTDYKEAKQTRIGALIEDPYRYGKKYWWNKIRDIQELTDYPDTVICTDTIPKLDSGKPDYTRIKNSFESLRKSPDQRTLALEKTASFIRTHRDRIFSVISQYQTEDSANIEIESALAGLDSARLEKAFENPPHIASTWVYMPSNVVLYSYVLYALIPSLWTDEITLRTAHRVSDVTVQLHEMLLDVHRLNITVVSESQETFLHRRKNKSGLVVFTGRSENVQEIAKSLEPGQILVFNGQGTNPFVVGHEADVDIAVCDLVRVRLLNGGQDCLGPDIIFVHESHKEIFLNKLKAGIDEWEKLEYRPPAIETNAILQITENISQNKKNVVLGGIVNVAQSSVQPTIMSWTSKDCPVITEVYAPIFNVVIFSREEEIQQILSDNHYKQRWMGASLYGTSDGLCAWFQSRMTVSKNSTLIDIDSPNLPFGGTGECSSGVFTHSTFRAQPVLLSRVLKDYSTELDEAAKIDSARELDGSKSRG